MLLVKGLVISGIDTGAICLASSAYFDKHRLNINEIKMFSDKELSIILFEAVRGNNVWLIQQFKKENIINDKKFFNNAMVFGYVAANNLKSLKTMFKNLAGDNSWINARIPIIEDEDHLDLLHWEDNPNITIIDRLILFALHYNSHKVLNYLIDDYSIPAYFLTRYAYTQSVTFYRWINQRILFSDELNKDILMEAAIDNNLPLVKELKRYIDLIDPPEYIGSIIFYNSYKVLNWLLKNFSYKPESLSLLLYDRSESLLTGKESNYAYKILFDYLKDSLFVQPG
jgi:hypothetical protein